MNNTFFLNVMTLEEIIDFFLPYFRDLHRNENYMDASASANVSKANSPLS